MRFKYVDSAITPNELDISTLSEAARYHPKITSYSHKLNNDTLEKFGKSGSFIIGDDTFKETKFALNFYVLANTDLIYRTKILDILNFFKQKNAPFFFQIEFDDTSVLQTPIQITDFKHDYKAEGLEHRYANVSINMTMPDPFLEDVSYTTVNFTGVTSGSEITITISDANCYEAFPIFTLTSSGFNPLVSLNNDANNLSISLADSNFTAGKVMVVNSENGEIKLGTNIKPNIKTAGYFIKLEQGTNNIQYQGSTTCDIQVQYKKRFLI